MAADVVIRRATPQDAAALGRLGAALVALHHSFDPQRFIAATPQTERGYAAFLKDEAQREGAFVLVAEQAGRVVGYAYGALEDFDWLALRGPCGAVHDLLVDPDHRGHGTGRRLLEAMAAALLDAGAPRIVLSTAHANADAQRLFAAAGFRPTLIEMARERPA
ncbi:GNAT family N-acetyltransferase [Phenylobacterium sp. J367]|uniref:GNAT family N-acetyltransferase n=1 Tax=Phenylobacterium sp. J367 TaxID=2898435 RepID=UPI0021512FC8|nr:GNAT family N-acetyltransferase [Phenylobacterium sp. J367]MCR5880376.1 GNAT family N-acetyltransferase [Phenylobacterium sp. J367]